MSLTFGMHKVVYLAALSVLVDNYVNRKTEEKLDFLEKTASWLTQNVALFRQQSNTKNSKRRKRVDEEEEEEKEDDVMAEVRRQPSAHQKTGGKVVSGRTVKKYSQGVDCQHAVSVPTHPENHQTAATKQTAHQTRDADTTVTTTTRQDLNNQIDSQIQEEMPRMQAVDQSQDVLAQAMMEGSIPMAADPASAELLSEDTPMATMQLLDSMVLKLNASPPQ